MPKKPKKESTLRQHAEDLLAQKGEPASLSLDDMANLVHELEVHEIELEMQNQELQHAQQRADLYIEELTYARQDLEQARDRYAELYDYAPTAYFTVDTYSGLILEMNVTAADLLMTTKTKAHRSRFAAFVEPEDADTFHICTRRALAERYRETCELRMRPADGPAFWALLDIRGEPESNQVRIAVTDITERKKAEQLKDDFIGMVSHELRTPITVIIGCLKVAQTEGITREEMMELLREADLSSEALSHILENLIELSRYQADRLKLNKARTKVEDVILEAVGPRTGYFNDHRLRLEIHTGLPAVKVDRVRLQQILRNLLDNAAKYSPADTEISVIARHENEHVLIGVGDRGKGISPEDQARLFEPFERLREKSTTRPGLGLGLLVCKRLVEAHGGKIWVDSKPGRGTTFWFTLPLPPVLSDG
jgi:PAS domain S-box-containing protein